MYLMERLGLSARMTLIESTFASISSAVYLGVFLFRVEGGVDETGGRFLFSVEGGGVVRPNVLGAEDGFSAETADFLGLITTGDGALSLLSSLPSLLLLPSNNRCSTS